ncbi:MAG: hypothetical protein ACM3IJ_02025 [Candidatus Levyibacteriota bacterium]
MDETAYAPSDEASYNDVRSLLSWTAPGRPFRKKSREFYLSCLLIFFLIEVIVFLFAQYQLMLAVAAITFLSIVLATVPPKDFHYRISTEGVKVEDHFYIWNELYDFYFKKIDKVDVLIIRTEALIPGELRITLGNVSRDHVRRVLINFLPYREVVRQTFMEKSADWLARNFPLDRVSS